MENVQDGVLPENLPMQLSGQNMIRRTNFPSKRTQLNSKGEYQRFWDQYGLGRHNSSGAQFTSKPIVCENKILTIPFSKGDWGGQGFQPGATVFQSLPYHKGKSVYWEYQIKFSETFDWGGVGESNRGGKFGPSVNTDYTSTSKPNFGDFNVMTMWRSGGQLDAYIYHVDQSDRYPDRNIFFTANRGQWYKIGVEVSLPGKVRIWIDDKMVFDKSFRFSNANEVTFQSAFGNFWGGNSGSWAARNDCDIQYKDIAFYERRSDSIIPDPDPDPDPDPTPDPIEDKLESVEIDVGSPGDDYYSAGTSYNVFPSLGGEYAFERYGNFSYSLPMKPGDYRITLKMASQYDGASNPGDRYFDIISQGVTIKENLDIVKEVGHRKPYSFSFKETSNGFIDLDFVKVKQNPMLNYILVEPWNDDPVPPANEELDKLRKENMELRDDIDDLKQEKLEIEEKISRAIEVLRN